MTATPVEVSVKQIEVITRLFLEGHGLDYVCERGTAGAVPWTRPVALEVVRRNGWTLDPSGRVPRAQRPTPPRPAPRRRPLPPLFDAVDRWAQQPRRVLSGVAQPPGQPTVDDRAALARSRQVRDAKPNADVPAASAPTAAASSPEPGENVDEVVGDAAPPTGPYVAVLAAGELFVDRSYQRPLDEARVRRMVKAWNPRLLGILDVSDRGPDASPRYAIVNGQHRWAAAVPHGAQMYLACNVHEGLDVAGEAALMHQLDATTRKLTSWDKWRARRAAGDRAVLGIEQVAAAHGFTVQPGSFGAVGAAERLYKAGGEVLLNAVVAILVAAHGPTPEVVKAPFLTGLGSLLQEHGASLEPERMSTALRKTTPAQLRGQADGLRQVDGRSLSAAMAYVMAVAYNRTPGPGPRLAT